MAILSGDWQFQYYRYAAFHIDNLVTNNKPVYWSCRHHCLYRNWQRYCLFQADFRHYLYCHRHYFGRLYKFRNNNFDIGKGRSRRQLNQYLLHHPQSCFRRHQCRNSYGVHHRENPRQHHRNRHCPAQCKRNGVVELYRYHNLSYLHRAFGVRSA